MKQRGVRPEMGLTDTLLSCGQQGIHLLFDTVTIRRAFARIAHDLIAERSLLAAHDAMRDLVELDGLDAMRLYLNALPSSTVDLLVYLYFRRLDRRLVADGPTLH